MKYTKILSTGSFSPAKVITNADLEKIVDTSDEWIMDRTGIKTRHIVSPNESSLTMAYEAGKIALKDAGINKNLIDLVIVATATPVSMYPNTASTLQYQLGLNAKSCPAFDINVACTGFIYALSIADQYIRNGTAKHALIVGSETLSRVVDWHDRGTCVIFADGAGAAVLGASDEPGVYSTHLHADGQYRDLLYSAGSLYSDAEPRHVKMRGNEVFKVAVTKLGEIVDEVLSFNKMKKEDIDWLVPHQANMRIIQAAAKKLNIPMERVIVTIAEQGNTSAASVPLALDAGIRSNRIKRNDVLLLEAFGSGFVWGAALLKY